MATAPGLNFVTLTPGCGYGDAGCQFIAGLDALGLPVTWTPTVANSSEVLAFNKSRRDLHDGIKDALLRLWRKPLRCGSIMVNIPPTYWHHYWRRTEPELRPFTYIAWEVEKVPPDWLPALNQYERVFAPSTFNRDALIAAGLSTRVEVVPHLARKVMPVLSDEPWGSVHDEDFVFYTIGTWTTRKAMEVTVRAYLDAFTAKDKVALIVKTEPVDQIIYYSLPEMQRQNAPSHVAMVWWTLAGILKDYPRPAKIHLIAKNLPAKEIDRLHSRGDCFISLAHSEGWGLGAFDALLFGNPVIITGWGGQLDYLGADYPLLVDYRLEPTAKSRPDGNYLHSPDAYWAHADRHHAAELMHQIYASRDKGSAIGMQWQMQLQERFGSERVCRRLAELIGFEL
jgi:hypothetical protein